MMTPYFGKKERLYFCPSTLEYFLILALYFLPPIEVSLLAMCGTMAADVVLSDS